MKRLYGGRRHITSAIVGTFGFVNYFNFASVETDNFSLAQLALGCDGSDPDNTTERVEVGITKNPVLYGDFNDQTPPAGAKVHFFIYFTTAGYNGLETDFVRGYDRRIAGFVPSMGAFPPGAVISVGGSGAERQIRAVLSGGLWWVQDTVGSTTTTLGYYPVGGGMDQVNFDLINASACDLAWYGEVFDDSEVDPNWTPANMGSGVLATTSGSAHFRQMVTERSSGGNQWFGSGGTNITIGFMDTSCYSVSSLGTGGGSGFDVWFLYGGPGGDASGCD